MRRSSFRLSIATLLVLGGCAAALAFVSGSNAGSTGASLTLFPQPPVVTVNGTGFIKASFRADPGSKTGSATHVAITVSLASGLVFDRPDSSPNCTTPGAPTDVVCTINSVSPGETVNRYVVFFAPSTSDSYTTNGQVVWDNGANGASGGGAPNPPLLADPVTTTVSATTDSSRGGGCFVNGGGKVQSGAANASDNQSTSADVVTVDPSLGIPCAYADVGEDSVGTGFVTAISHDNIAKLTGAATIKITLYSLPIPFNKIVWRYFATYNSASPPAISDGTPIAPCTGGKLPSTSVVPCLLNSVKSGKGATWTFLQNGTGSDPGYGA